MVQEPEGVLCVLVPIPAPHRPGNYGTHRPQAVQGHTKVGDASSQPLRGAAAVRVRSGGAPPLLGSFQRSAAPTRGRGGGPEALPRRSHHFLQLLLQEKTSSPSPSRSAPSPRPAPRRRRR